jgi:hypothetical protein
MLNLLYIAEPKCKTFVISYVSVGVLTLLQEISFMREISLLKLFQLHLYVYIVVMLKTNKCGTELVGPLIV